MSQVERFSGEHAGHAIELEFDKRRLVINEATLRVDGADVDRTRVVYGDKESAHHARRRHRGRRGHPLRHGRRAHTRAGAPSPDGRWTDLGKM